MVMIIVLVFAAFGLIQIVNRIANRFSRPVATWIHWVRAVTVEALSVCATTILRPTHYLPSHRKALGSRTGRPILLIHGYLHDSSAWVYLKRKLQQGGFGPIYCLNFGHPFRSIRILAEKVKEKVQEIEQETNRRGTVLIGHSMGGLVSAWYATHIAEEGQVTGVITIGSPLGGTHVAKIGLGPNAREMERGSRLSQELQDAIKTCTHIPFYHIGTKTDQLVIPHTSSIIEGHPGRQFLVDDIGHCTLLFSPRVAHTIQKWLKD